MSAFWWVELDLSPLIDRATSVGVFWGVCGLSMTLGSLYADGWVCVPVLLVVWHGHSALESAVSWIVLGCGVEMETSRRALAD